MLFDILDEIVGRRSKVRLLRALSSIDRAVSGREAARLAGLSHRAMVSLDDLVALGIVNRGETAGQHLYTFNREHVLAGPILAVFEAERRRVDSAFAHLVRVAESAEVEYAGIFGSSARNEAEPQSDLDLLVLVLSQPAGERVHNAFVEAGAELQSHFGLRLSPVVLTLDRARRQVEEGDPFMAAVRKEVRRVYGPDLEDLIDG